MQNRIHKINLTSIGFFALVLLISILFYILNTEYPIYLDDWFYSFNMVSGNRVGSLYDIFESQYAHYFEWGGRNVVHAIDQLLLWGGDTLSNFFNTLAYLALVLLMYFYSNQSQKINPILFFLINVAIWFLLPSFSQNLLWITGSANYLWGCLIILVFLHYYITYYYSNKAGSNIKRSLFLFGFGMLAGWTNENTVVGLIFFLIGLYFLMRIDKIAIPKWFYWGFLGVVIGAAIMLSSPGNAIRNKLELLSVHHIGEGQMHISFYFYRMITMLKMMYLHLFLPVCIYLCVLVFYLYNNRQYKNNKNLNLSLLFFFTSIIAALAMSASPVFPERAWFGIIIFMIISISILYSKLEFKSLKIKVINYAIFISLVFLFSVSYIESYSELKRFREVCDERERVIDEQILKGETNLIIYDDFFKQRDSKLIVMELKDWLMIDIYGDRYARYKGIENIQFKIKSDSIEN